MHLLCSWTVEILNGCASHYLGPIHAPRICSISVDSDFGIQSCDPPMHPRICSISVDSDFGIQSCDPPIHPRICSIAMASNFDPIPTTSEYSPVTYLCYAWSFGIWSILLATNSKHARFSSYNQYSGLLQPISVRM
jgi:hypothetical protein